MKVKALHVHLPEGLFKRLALRCVEEGKSKKQVTIDALESYLKPKK